jgi:hypothetical protein
MLKSWVEVNGMSDDNRDHARQTRERAMRQEDDMTVEMTLNLPESLVENARRFGGATRQNVETVLTDTLEMMLPMIEDSPDEILYPPVSTLSDLEVLQLADGKMDLAQNQRLGELQAKGKASGLSVAERQELVALMRIYQIGLLRKSEAMVEAVQRGLRQPLAA